jgi:hypothetical protein
MSRTTARSSATSSKTTTHLDSWTTVLETSEARLIESRAPFHGVALLKLICLWTIYEESTACVRGSRVHSKPAQAPHNSLGLPTFELVNSAKLDFNSTYVPPPTPHGNLESPLCIVFVHVRLPDPLAFIWYTLANMPSVINHRIVVNHDGLQSEQCDQPSAQLTHGYYGIIETAMKDCDFP